MNSVALEQALGDPASTLSGASLGLAGMEAGPGSCHPVAFGG